MKKNIHYLVAALFFGCCTFKNNPTFTIENQSDREMDSILIGVSRKQPSIILNLAKNQRSKGKISFDKSVTGDGSFFMEIYNDGRLSMSKSFGYYTNGESLNSQFNIIVYNDSINVKY